MTNEAQARLWNDAVGEAWVRHAEAYDETLEPFGHAAMDRLELAAGQRVLDVGCGTGATTVELAARVVGGGVVGVDLSERMLDRARRRPTPPGAAPVRFVVADAQSDPLPDGPFERVFSRFGVMFFSDPELAFARLAESMASRGRMAFVCFKAPDANPFILLPVMAVADHLPLPPLPAPDAPSPFSLADANRVRRLLEGAGLVDVELVDGPDSAAMHGNDVPEIARRLLEQNPLTGPALEAATEEAGRGAVAAAADAIGPHLVGGAVRMDASTWVVSARKP